MSHEQSRSRTNIPYTTTDTDNPFTQFDIYYTAQDENDNNSTPNSPLICFVHGGGWISYVWFKLILFL